MTDQGSIHPASEATEHPSYAAQSTQPTAPETNGASPTAIDPPVPPTAPAAAVKPRRRRRPPRFPLYQRWWMWLLVGLGATAGGTAFAAIRAVQVIQAELPDTGDVLTFVRDGTLTIKASDGTILQQKGPATREALTYDEIPRQLVEAFIAAEDEKFYAHDGIDYQAILRAVYANLRAGDLVEGGSTITQQLARIVFLDQSRTMERKVREALLARKIEENLDKQKILERYLNLVYLGSGAYGVADAAWIYFSKSVDDLTLSEIAMIAGLAPAPSAYSPLVNLDAARRRRDLTLQRMVTAGFITPGEMAEVIDTPLELSPSLPRNFHSTTPYFTSYIQEQLPNYISAEELERGGLTVETTLNPEWQRIAEETVQQALTDYSQWQNFRQAALVTVEPKTGAIRAMVGGTDFSESQFNRVTQAQRQPGSTFKTFVYSTAIAAGFSPYKDYVDAKLSVDGYEPENYGKRYRGTVSMRDALVSSINVVAVKTLIDVGFDPVINLAQQMGIRSELLPTYSLALGTSEVNLLEITNAYGTLANRGNFVEAHGIVRVLNRYDEVIYEADFAPKRALDETSSDIVNWMLQGVVQSGTGGNAGLGDRQVAGKTGTSEERRDLWFIGYIPQLVTGVWLGNDDNEPTWGASSTAAAVWRNFMSQIVADMQPEYFAELPQLNNREATITAEPVKPGKVQTASAGSQESAPERSRSYSRSSAPAPDNPEPAPASEPSPSPSRQRSAPAVDAGGGDRSAPEAADTPDNSNPAPNPGNTGGNDDGGTAPVVDDAPAPQPVAAPEPAPPLVPLPPPPAPPIPRVQPISPSANPIPLPAESVPSDAGGE
ncbi:MAG: penicillin-binding protein 1A [Synechococcales bacterium]|nr:penicillin-binding protein 1A [Synechococcales bacterium]